MPAGGTVLGGATVGRPICVRSRDGAHVADRAEGRVHGRSDGLVGEAPPAAAELAGRGVVARGHAHIKTITQTGGAVLGCRGLHEDGLIAESDPESTWGFMYITRLAAWHFGST